MRRERVSIALGLCLALAPTAYSAAPERRPNIVMIVVDDMRFDEFGAGGHSYLETPNIDRLAREGATFSRAYHATPLCSPNRASILTGQYASRHGILDNTSRSHASHRLALFPRGAAASRLPDSARRASGTWATIRLRDPATTTG